MDNFDDNFDDNFGKLDALPDDPAACPTFKSDASPHRRPTQLLAPSRCQTVADVVKAFNADVEFTFCDLGSHNHMMGANRTELWGQGCRVFLVRYHNSERLMGLVPVGRARRGVNPTPKGAVGRAGVSAQSVAVAPEPRNPPSCAATA